MNYYFSFCTNDRHTLPHLLYFLLYFFLTLYFKPLTCRMFPGVLKLARSGET